MGVGVGGGGVVLTDVNLFSIRDLMRVNRQLRPWDQHGPAWISSTAFNESSSWSCWHEAWAVANLTRRRHQASLRARLLTFTSPELGSADRPVWQRAGALSGVDALFMELRLVNVTPWQSCKETPK